MHVCRHNSTNTQAEHNGLYRVLLCRYMTAYCYTSTGVLEPGALLYNDNACLLITASSKLKKDTSLANNNSSQPMSIWSEKTEC